MTKTEVEVKHWKHQSAALKVFWKRAGDLGLDEEEAHRALSVDGSRLPSLEDFEGTVAEAIAGLELYAAEHYGDHTGDGGADDLPETTDVREPQSNDAQSPPQAPAPQEVETEPETEPSSPLNHAALFQACGTLPEAPTIAWTKFIDTQGFTWSVTIRAGLPPNLEREAMASVVRSIGMFAKAAKKYSWIPESGLYRSPSGAGVTAPPRQANGTPPPPGMRAPGYGNGPQDAPQPKAGTVALKAIKVDPDGRVEFHVDGYKWPFKDGRGPETVLGLFDEAIVGSPNGWTEGHFAPGSKHEPLTGLVVDWEKPDRYYNVVRVRVV